MALSDDRVEETVEAWSDINQVADLAETIQKTLVR